MSRTADATDLGASLSVSPTHTYAQAQAQLPQPPSQHVALVTQTVTTIKISIP
jgi:hypothetical protein